jgi:hypothetical protein
MFNSKSVQIQICSNLNLFELKLFQNLKKLIFLKQN